MPLADIQLQGLIKLFVLTLLVFYFIFTLVVYRQITLMTEILDSAVSPVVKLLAIFQIIVVGLLFAACVIAA